MSKENAFVAEHSYLNELFENAQEAIVVADKNGLVLRINGEFTRLFGFTEAEVIGERVDSILVPQEYKDRASKITKMAAQGEHVEMDSVRQTKDGALIDVSILASPIESNGNIATSFAIYRDITERKEAERTLELKNEFNELISSVSARLVTFSDFDEAVEHTLANIGEFTEAHAAVLYKFRECEPLVDCTHEWHKNGTPLKARKGQTLLFEDIAWLKKRLQVTAS